MKRVKTLLFTALVLFSLNSSIAAVIEVSAGGNIAAAIRKATAADTVYLHSGNYTMTGVVTILKDVVLMGDAENKPVIQFTTLKLTDKAKTVVLENLHIVSNRKYIVYNANEDVVDIDDIIIKNCVIDLNGGVGSSVMLNRSAAETNRMKNIVFDNCIVYNGQAQAHGLILVSRESSAQISNITLKGSTFTDFARGVMFVGSPMDNLIINIDNCTTYNVNKTENTGAIFNADQGNTEFIINKCIFDIPGRSPKLIEAGSGGIVAVADCYRTDAQPKLRNLYSTKTLEGDAKTVFAAPANDPTAPATSFEIIDAQISDKGIGDLRWNK